MYKVLLVDDEIFVRKGLMNLIDWVALGYEICGEADNGEEALKAIDLHSPDLVIADIRMPVLDGLELIRTLTETSRQSPAFIIISGYHDFQYAQRALRYGVHDYILKPVDDAELSAVLKKLSGTLGLRKAATLAGGSLVTESIVDTLIHGHFAQEDARALSAALRMEERSSFAYVIAELHPRTAEDGKPGWTAKELAEALRHFAPAGCMERDIPVYEQSPGTYGLLLDLNRLEPEGASLAAVCEALQPYLASAADRPVTLYAGQPVERLQDMKDSYQSANGALAYKYAEDGASVVYAERVLGTPLYYFDIDSELYASLLERLEENDMKGCGEALEAVFRHFVEKRFAPVAVGNAVTRFVIAVINIIREMEGSEKRLLQLPKVMDGQQKGARLQDLKRELTAFLEEASAYIAELRNAQSKGGIERVRKYIDAHYTENISLKSIAATFYMNAVYLGQLFRKTYGVYFNEYLLGLRITEAKKLLRQTDLRMYEVAERVGFQNADYFVTQFEKLERVTPTDYRNKLLGKK